MAGFGAIAGFIYLIVFLAILILGILLPVFVFRIYQESIKTNKLLEQLIACVLDPKAAAEAVPNYAEIKKLQESYRKRR
ncbi:hypothetical protein [uncultured Desulfuromusa sp.]|uniref:hypothetical protein n=1 Tax=uncultured Desulfuromusa sp. TaxID=219183 RepID=UPI002AA7A652|nr:hypothetical protein [uncultured Desulfuromusa sp.]